MDHTVIDAGHHRLLMGTIRLASANGRYLRDPSVPLVLRTAPIAATLSPEQVPPKVGSPPRAGPESAPDAALKELVPARAQIVLLVSSMLWSGALAGQSGLAGSRAQARL